MKKNVASLSPAVLGDAIAYPCLTVLCDLLMSSNARCQWELRHQERDLKTTLLVGNLRCHRPPSLCVS